LQRWPGSLATAPHRLQVWAIFSLLTFDGIFDVFPPGQRHRMAGSSAIRIGNDSVLSIVLPKAVTGFSEEDVEAAPLLRTDTGIDYFLAFRYDHYRY